LAEKKRFTWIVLWPVCFFFGENWEDPENGLGGDVVSAIGADDPLLPAEPLGLDVLTG